MSKTHSEPMPPAPSHAGNVCFLPIQSLKTSYACLRPGALSPFPNDTAELPLRVVPTDDGQYEVIDGFKRLFGWREQGHTLIPVVLERPSLTEEHKRLLLLANSPPRTLTALDEARVVFSLLTDEGLSQNAIARKLRRKPQWVARRVDLASRLSPTAQTQLAHGSIGPTLAHVLCAPCLFAEHFELLDSHHQIVFSRRYAPEADKGKLIIDPTHYATLKRRPATRAHQRLGEAFLKRFPSLAPLLSGLQLRMKALAPIHLRALLRLVDSYGEEAFLTAATQAQDYRRFDAKAVERILERHYPLLEDTPVAPLGGTGVLLLSEVDSGSLEDYSRLDLDERSPQAKNDNDDPEDNHGS